MIADVVNVLARRRFRYNTEVDLHEAIAAAFDAAGIAYEREVQIAGGRIDFIVRDVGIEVKIKGSTEALRRQVEGYSAEERLTEVLVVTTRPTHRPVSGLTTNGKRVRVLTIGGLSL